MILTVKVSLEQIRTRIRKRPEESVACVHYLHDVLKDLHQLVQREGLVTDDKITIAELMRRVERLIGQAIRRGQDEGKIAKRGSIGGLTARGVPGSLSKAEAQGRTRGDHLIKVTDLLGYSTAAAMTFLYDMAEPITEDQFEMVMSEARAQHRVLALSRTKIITEMRRVSKRDPNFNLKQLKNLAATGHNIDQIVAYTGMKRSRVRELVRRYDIDLPGDYGKTRSVDDLMIIKRTVEALEGMTAALEVFDPDQVENADDRDHWVESVTRSIKALVKFHKQLKEL